MLNGYCGVSSGNCATECEQVDQNLGQKARREAMRRSTMAVGRSI